MTTAGVVTAMNLVTGGSASILLARAIGALALAQRCEFGWRGVSADNDTMSSSRRVVSSSDAAPLSFPLSMVPGWSIGTAIDREDGNGSISSRSSETAARNAMGGHWHRRRRCVFRFACRRW